MSRQVTRKKSSPSTVKRASAAGQFVAEPSSQQLHKEMRAFGAKLRDDKTAARKFLVGAGILTEKGNLRKAFGG